MMLPKVPTHVVVDTMDGAVIYADRNGRLFDHVTASDYCRLGNMERASHAQTWRVYRLVAATTLRPAHPMPDVAPELSPYERDALADPSDAEREIAAQPEPNRPVDFLVNYFSCGCVVSAQPGMAAVIDGKCVRCGYDNPVVRGQELRKVVPS